MSGLAPWRLLPIETPAVVICGDNAEKDLPETLDGLRAGLSIRRGDPGALRLRQAPLQLTPAFGQFKQPLATIVRAAMLDDETLSQQLTEHPVEALLGDSQNAEQLSDRHLRVASDKMYDPMVSAAKAVLVQNRVRLGGEVTIGEKQQFDAVADLLLARRREIDAG